MLRTSHDTTEAVDPIHPHAGEDTEHYDLQPTIDKESVPQGLKKRNSVPRKETWLTIF
jgi:hypothetical protein